MSAEQEHFNVQAFGVVCLAFTVLVAWGIRLNEPLSLLPPVLLYAFLQGVFRLGVRRAKRPLQKRTLVFIA